MDRVDEALKSGCCQRVLVFGAGVRVEVAGEAADEELKGVTAAVDVLCDVDTTRPNVREQRPEGRKLMMRRVTRVVDHDVEAGNGAENPLPECGVSLVADEDAGGVLPPLYTPISSTLTSRPTNRAKCR